MAKSKRAKIAETYANSVLSLGFMVFVAEIWFFLDWFSSTEGVAALVFTCAAIVYCTNRFGWQYRNRYFRHFYQQQNDRFAHWKEQAKTFYDTQYPHLDLGENRTFTYFKQGAKIQATTTCSRQSTLYCKATPINDSIVLTYKWIRVKTQQVLGRKEHLEVHTLKVETNDLIECHVTAQSPCGTKTTTIDTIKLQPHEPTPKTAAKRKSPIKSKSKRTHNPMWDVSVHLKKQVY